MKDLIKRYENLLIYRRGLLCLMWAPVPVAAIKLQGELLTPTMITIIVALPSILGLFSKWLQQNLDAMVAAYIHTILNLMYIATLAGGYLLGVEPWWLLLLGPAFKAVGDKVEQTGASKTLNEFKSHIAYDLFYAREVRFSSACNLTGQAGVFLLYNQWQDIPMLQLWLAICISYSAIYSILDWDRIRLLKLMRAKAVELTV